MAEPILLKLPPRDPREALYHRLENAPQDHVEALLAAYDILQGLHDKGLLEIAKGALGSGEKILQILVDAGNSPEVIRGIRNLVILAKIADSIQPEVLENLQRAVANGMEDAKTKKPPGLLQLAKQAGNEDTRRALGLLTGVLQALGSSLERKPESGPPGP
jgi:uncharacterized protein YjgD (DUF1641 family)